ncbi:MAG: PAS domain S-box protein, partial [Chitinophagaceae bacterium]|nr:PAS domain S-box protein [Chitinophagaceae bacterium]
MSKKAVMNKKPLNRALTNAEEISFLQTDANGIIISVSEQLSLFTGFTVKDLVGSSLVNIVSKKDQPKLASFLKKEKTAGKENIVIALKGARKNRSFQFSVQYIPGNHHRNFLLIWNIDLKRSVRTTTAKTELAVLSRMFQPNPQPVIIYDPSGNHIIFANNAACAFYGYIESEFAELLLTDLFQKETERNEPFTTGSYFFKPNNDKRVRLDVVVSSIAVDGKIFQIAFTNIQNSVKEKPVATTALQSQKDFSEAWEILDNAPEIFFKLDIMGNFIFVSNEFERVLGYSKEEIRLKHFSSIILEDDIDIARQGFADIFQFGRAKGNVIFRIIKKNGGFEWFSTSGIFVYDKEGKPVHCIGFAQNITELKQLVEKLEASEERYAAFINHSSEAIWRFETAEPLPINLPEEQLIVEFISKGYLAECNDQMARLYGFDAAGDLAGSPLTNFIPAEDPATLDYFKGFIQSGFKLVNVETHETDRDGNEKIFLNNLLGIVEKDRLIRVWGTQRDITEQRIAEKNAKEQLEQSENFFKSLISDSLDGIVVLDAKACITYAAASITNVLGYLPNEVNSRNCFEFVHPDDLPAALRAFNEIKKIKSRYLEIRFQSKQGEWLWMLVRANNLYHQPSIKGMVVYFTDITQRKQTENILKESEKRFRHLADTVPVMIWVTDENNKSTYVSKCWTDFTGVSLEKIVADGWATIIHPDDHRVAIDHYNFCFKSKEAFVIEYRVRSIDGEFKWVVDHGVPRFTPDGVFMGYIGSVVDIHNRKTAEQKLRYQAEMLENIGDSIISTDLNFNVIAWNTMAEEIYGLKKEEVIGRPLRSVVKHQYISISQENVLIELYEKGNWEGEVYFDRNDGKRIYLFFSLSFVKNDRGERIGLVGIHRDITQRYEAEMALRISEERYRSVVDALNEGIILQDEQGKIIACNKSAAYILGNELIGSSFKLLDWKCVKEDGTAFTATDNPLTVTAETGKPLEGIIMGLQRQGNPFYWFSVNTEPIYYSGERLLPDAVVTSFFDITQRKHQEQWLSLEKDVLEINAKSSSTLKNTVDFYLRGIEKMFPDMICSILMLRDDKQSIQHLSAPSLPLQFSEAINGAKIGP